MLGDFSWNVWRRHLYKKAWHFALCDVFIYKKSYTSQKARKCAIRFYIQKPGTLRYAIFYWIFEICGGGWHLLIKKQFTLRELFVLKKRFIFHSVAIYKEPDTMCYILISKKEYTFMLRLYIYNLSCSTDTWL